MAEQVVEVARQRVPVRSGELRDSITVQPIKSKPGLVVGHAGPAARRSHLLEFGTRHHPAQAYMRPALDQVAPGAGLVFVSSYRPVVRQAARAARRDRKAGAIVPGIFAGFSE